MSSQWYQLQIPFSTLTSVGSTVSRCSPLPLRSPCPPTTILLSELGHLFLEAACLCHHRACRSALISPVRRQDTDGLVVAAEAVDAGFDEDKAELGVFVLAVALEVLADGHGLGQSMRTKHKNFVSQLE